jgi:hypothetical protein
MKGALSDHLQGKVVTESTVQDTIDHFDLNPNECQEAFAPVYPNVRQEMNYGIS